MLKLSKPARLIPIFGIANHEFTHWVQTCPQTLAPLSNLQINSPKKQQNKFIKRLLWEYKMIPQLELENIVQQGGHLCTIARSTCAMLSVLNSMVFNFTLKPSPPSAKKRFNTWKQKYIQIYPLVKLREIQLKLLAENKDSLIFFFIRFISSNLHVGPILANRSRTYP